MGPRLIRERPLSFTMTSRLQRDYLWNETSYWKKMKNEEKEGFCNYEGSPYTTPNFSELWPPNGWDSAAHFRLPLPFRHCVFTLIVGCHMFGRKPYLHMKVKNWGFPTIKRGTPKLPIFERFPTASRNLVNFGSQMAWDLVAVSDVLSRTDFTTISRIQRKHLQSEKHYRRTWKDFKTTMYLLHSPIIRPSDCNCPAIYSVSQMT